jgi:translation initiation factor 1
MARDDKKKPVEPAAPFHNPFGALRGLRSALPEAPPEATARKAAPVAPARAVVRMERKGRGGKEVTVVAQLGLAHAELERWLKRLKSSLGCGGAVEGEDLILQGDQRDRVPALLTEQGVRHVIIG